MKHLAGIFTTLVCAGLLGQSAAQCLAGYLDSTTNTNPSSCYRINLGDWPNDGRSWTVAREQCRNEGGDLAVITSPQELNYLTSQIKAKEYPLNVVWHVGLERKSDNSWLWVDGTQVDETIVIWNGNQVTDGDYGALDTDSKFRQVYAYSADLYICERSKYTISTCDETQGWSQTHDGKTCIKVIGNSNYNISRARSTCESMSADLVLTNTDSVNNLVAGKLKDGQTSWIGLSTYYNFEVTSENVAQWQWLDKKNLEGYIKWENPEATKIAVDKRYQGCATVNKNGLWNVLACNEAQESNKFTCQRPSGECPAGWTLDNGMCYLIGYNMSWPEAYQDCMSRGAHLVVISDNATQLFIESKLHDFVRNNVKHIWIGYKQSGPQEQYDIIVSSTSSQTNWDVGQPVYGNLPYGCARISTTGSGKWSSSTCADLNGYMCQLPRGRSVKGPEPDLPYLYKYCEAGWVQWNQECYMVMREMSTFDHGDELCTPYNAHLAYIEQIDYQAFLTRITEKNEELFWIGLRKTAPGDYQWITGKPVDTFRNFADDINDQDDNSNCGFMYGGGLKENAGRWNFANCDFSHRVICSKDPTTFIPPPPTPPPYPSGNVSMNCPSGWESDGSTDYCYYFMSYGTTYTNAQHGCRTMGGDLAYIHSKEAMKYIATRINRLNLGWWIGLNTIGDPLGYYKWTLLNEPVAFTRWQTGQPEPRAGDCVIIVTESGMWEIADCSKLYNFICQRKGYIVSPTRPPIQYSTPAGGSLECKDSTWFKYSNNNYCYKFFNGSKTWADALAQCKKEHDLGTLVSIANENEQLFVQLLAYEKAIEAGVKSETIWIGMTDTLDALYPRMVQYVWEDDTPVRYTNWLPREPSSSDVQCVALNAQKDGEWHDLDCATNNVDGFMCKSPPIAVSAPKTTTALSGCPKNYNHAYEDKCFYINPAASVSFDKAKQSCVAQGGSLLVLSTRQEQNYISVALSASSVFGSKYWMGLSGTNDDWKWVDGTTPTFTNWDSSYTSPQTLTCAAVDATTSYPGLWTQKDCGAELPYICQANRVGWTRTTQHPTTAKGSCPAGWTTSGTRCYLPVAKLLTLPDALTYCEQKYVGLLASFTSVKEQADVAQSMSLSSVNDAWIGFGKRDDLHGWQWMDGTPLLYEQWDNNEPDRADDTKSCAFMSLNSERSEGVWISDTCTTTQRNVICMRPLSDNTFTTTKLPDTNGTELCNGTGWSVYGSYCYYPYQSSQPWTRGRDLCDSIQADLVSIASAEENAFVHQLVLGDPHLFTWIGLSEIGYNGFYWTDSSPLSYTDWDTGAHDIDGPCVAMAAGSGKWSNQHCDSKFSFVCKKPISGAVVRPTTAPPSTGGCPPDSVTFSKSSRCFRIVTGSKLSQSDAIAECQRGIGRIRNLASFADVTDLNFVISKLRNVTKVTNAAHIGLMDFSTVAGQPSYRWLDSSVLYFTNWDVNEPNVQPSTPPGTCVSMQLAGASPGNWNVQKNCDNPQAFVCSMLKSTAYNTPSEPNLCDAGFIQYNEHCYFVDGLTSATAVSWNAANDACYKWGAELVSIHDAYEQAAVTWAVLSSGSVTTPVNFWTGLNTNNAPDTWAWSDTWPVDFTRWLPTEPSESTAKRCAAGVIRGNLAPEAGDWASLDCRTKQAYVCRKTKGKPNKDDTIFVDGTCPSGWLSGISKCYYMDSTARVVWSESILKCRALNGTFGTIDTENDNQMLAIELTRQKVVNGLKSEDVWLGISSSGSGVAAADGSAVSYLNWADGVQPVPGLTQGVYMDQTSYWHLGDPNEKLGFVCKRAKSPRPTFPPVDPTRTSEQPDSFTKQPSIYVHNETFSNGVGIIIAVCVSLVVLLAGLAALLVYLKRKNMVPQKVDQFVSKSSAAARTPSVYSPYPSSSGPSTSSGLVGFENVTFEAPRDPCCSTVPKPEYAQPGETIEVYASD